MKHFTSWEEIKPTATEAEKKLKAAMANNSVCICGPSDEFPELPHDWAKLPNNREIRSDVLRYLILLGDRSPLQIKGTLIFGAYISGNLDLSDCDIKHKLHLHGCRFQSAIFAQRSHWHSSLRLQKCYFLSCDLTGSYIEGQLSFEDSFIYNPHQVALRLEDARISQPVFLNSTRIFGTTNLLGIKIQGSLQLINTSLDVGSPPLQENKLALVLERAEISNFLFFSRIPKVKGQVNLQSATVSDLVDQSDSWKNTPELVLDGFSYKRISGPTDAKTRLEWLDKADQGKDKFYPQPYKQLAKVLHDMGHEHDAREVSYVLAEKLETERLRRIREDRQEAIRDAAQPGKAIGLSLYLGSLRIWKFLFGLLVGYGWRPFRSLSALVLLIFAFWLPTLGAWHFGDFAPNSGVLLQGHDWIEASDHPNAANEWSDSVTGRDWESFHSFAYAADVVIPIIEFGQTDAWAPSTERGAWGALLWWLRWPFTLAGWLVTALGAAALTGVIRRE